MRLGTLASSRCCHLKDHRLTVHRWQPGVATSCFPVHVIPVRFTIHCYGCACIRVLGALNSAYDTTTRRWRHNVLVLLQVSLAASHALRSGRNLKLLISYRINCSRSFKLLLPSICLPSSPSALTHSQTKKFRKKKKPRNQSCGAPNLKLEALTHEDRCDRMAGASAPCNS